MQGRRAHACPCSRQRVAPTGLQMVWEDNRSDIFKSIVLWEIVSGFGSPGVKVRIPSSSFARVKRFQTDTRCVLELHDKDFKFLRCKKASGEKSDVLGKGVQYPSLHHHWSLSKQRPQQNCFLMLSWSVDHPSVSSCRNYVYACVWLRNSSV